jgi:hypothetical protein
VGMMTEPEYVRARVLSDRCRMDPHFVRVGGVVAADFASPSANGVLRLREHPLFRDEFQLKEFMAILAEIFSR